MTDLPGLDLERFAVWFDAACPGEIGGPPVAEPARRGFGTRFIERGVAREFDGLVNLSFEPTGLICRLRIPLSLKLRMAA